MRLQIAINHKLSVKRISIKQSLNFLVIISIVSFQKKVNKLLIHFIAQPHKDLKRTSSIARNLPWIYLDIPPFTVNRLKIV